MAETTNAYRDPLAGQFTGMESSLSNWAGPYVTNMLGQGQALAQMPYQPYMGPLTAGESNLQSQAFSGLANLAMPDMSSMSYTPGSFTTPGTAEQFMSPFMSDALEPQIAEARRQAELQRIMNAGRLTKAGAFGGSRQAIMEAEGDRNLLRNLADITGRGYETAFQQGRDQFNTEEARRMAATGQAQQYGLQALGAQLGAGGMQRDIEREGIAADMAQFEQERDFPYRQVQYMQSLLQGLPLATQSYGYIEPSQLTQLLSSAGGITGLLKDIGILKG